MASYRRRGAHAARPAAAPTAVATGAVAPAPAAAAGTGPPGGKPGGDEGTGRKRAGGLRARPSTAKVIAAVLAVSFGAMGFAGGLWSTPSAEPTVQAFLLAWQDQQYSVAAALTTGNPAKVAADLASAYQQLDAAAFYLTMGPISQHGNLASADFGASVDLGQDGAPWTYPGHFTLRVVGSQWRVVWSPSVINPHLKPGYRLAVRSSTLPRQLLLNAAGRPLQTPSVVYAVGVRPDRLARPAVTARVLGSVTGLDPSQLLGWIRAAPASKFQELVLLPPARYRRDAAALSGHGLVVKRWSMRLFTSIAPTVVGRVGTEDSGRLRDEGIAYRPGATIGLDGLQQAFQRSLAGTPSTEVVMETAAGKHVTVLARWPGSAPKAVRTTIDSRVQKAAQRAVGSLPVSSALVAVQASTGNILAVAANKANGLPAVDPLAKGYPPGAAFTLVSAQALLARGLSPNAQVLCRASNVAGGRVFKNFPPVGGLGPNATFTDDFAHACATAFVGLSLNLTPQDLNTAAAAFGLGSTWSLPLPAFPGAVRASGGRTQLALDTIGQGSVEVSPLAMALAAARVDAGAWHAPGLIAGQRRPSASRTQAAGLSPQSLGTLRGLLRAAARSTRAAKADAHGQQVFGQVGTAPLQVRDHHLWVTWFVGYRGDVAFAVMQVSDSPATSAVPAAQNFLGALPRH